jgi:Asp-tRNA(Asn)/Glu-tRNA(Gln) amidotransferase A subunit family amidase
MVLRPVCSKGTRTTYGTPPFKDQVIDEDAFVYQQLKDAGAVLIAKLSMGELAMDDIWFGGQTKTLEFATRF